MIRVGLISNPLSQQNRRSMPAVRDLLAKAPHVLPAELQAIADLPEVLREFARREVGLVAISGGDGTVHAVMTELLNGGMFERPPLLAVLPAGMTNLISHDVGLRGRLVPALARLLDGTSGAALGGERITRSILSVQRAPGEQPFHGMFFGTAGFPRAVELVRDKVHPLGAERHYAAALGVGLSLLRLLWGRTERHNLWHGDRMSVALDGAPARTGDYILFLATTLERLILGVWPFWGEGDAKGAVRYTAIDFPPRHPLSAIWPVVRGRSRPWLAAAGYRSGRVGSCTLGLDCPMVLDGEVIAPAPSTPVRLGADRRITFWRP
ncbi:MAG TPA: diacylglycerol kinase family protein [Dongiaceae bacterium]|nr:diacylglycerol kinase family protein [Dongiaceae bacterium]